MTKTLIVFLLSIIIASLFLWKWNNVENNTPNTLARWAFYSNSECKGAVDGGYYKLNECIPVNAAYKINKIETRD